MRAVEFFLQRGQFLFQPGQFFPIGFGPDLDRSTEIPRTARPGVDAFFGDVREEGGEGIEILLRVGVELVVVTLGATHRRAHPDRRGVADTFGGVLGQVLLWLNAALGRHHPQPVVPRGDLVMLGAFRKQVPGQLLARETVVGNVPVERFDHVVAVRRNTDVLIAVVTDRVGVTDDVQPVHRHPFAIMRRCEQPVDEVFIRLRILVGDERLHLLRRRG